LSTVATLVVSIGMVLIGRPEFDKGILART
jgi:hypothetical protein